MSLAALQSGLNFWRHKRLAPVIPALNRNPAGAHLRGKRVLSVQGLGLAGYRLKAGMTERGNLADAPIRLVSDYAVSFSIGTTVSWSFSGSSAASAFTSTSCGAGVTMAATSVSSPMLPTGLPSSSTT